MNDNLTVKRFKDLATRSYNNNTFEFTDFLTANELDEFESVKCEFKDTGFEIFGGYALAERKMIRFGSPEALGYEVDFPIECLEIKSVSEKWATEVGHRDFLGALMNLGVDRKVFGDIVVKDKKAYLFCNARISDYVKENLISVGRNQVSVEKCCFPEDNYEKEKEETNIQVNSMRADAVIARCCHLSRGAVLPLFTQKLVTLNGVTLMNKDKQFKEGDVFSVRGYGKFAVGELKGKSKKGKENVEVFKYV